MINTFVQKRPSIPLGTRISDFPPVLRPLHSEEWLEVYLLDEEPQDGMLILLLVRADSEEHVELILREWWEKLPEGSVKCEHLERLSVSGREQVQVVLRVFGDWIPDCSSKLSFTEDAELREIVFEVCSLAEKGREQGLCPLFGLSLTWLRKMEHQLILVPIIPRRWSDQNEVSAVIDFAKLLYFVVAGISSSNSSKDIVRLSAWAKNVSNETSKVLAACLLPQSHFNRVSDFAGLALTMRGNDLGKTRRILEPSQKNSGLAKVAGMHLLKSLLQEEVIRPLREPETFQQYGLTVPNGMLLFGPPGCGKTYIAKQLAEELEYNYLEIVPSEVAGSYIHQTVLKIRDVFERAAEMAPSIVFIDEFEALVPPRAELGAHQQYKAEEVNELLVHLNTCAERNIFLIAATNEPHKIDPAVRRTGRLDKLIYVGPPDEEARSEMLKLHLSNRPLAEDVDVGLLARDLLGYSASDIKFLVDEAARMALKQDRSPITMDLLLKAIKRVPPSVMAEDEARFQSFAQRGTA